MEPIQPDINPENRIQDRDLQAAGLLPAETPKNNTGLLMWVVAGIAIIMFSGIGYTTYYYQKNIIQPQLAETPYANIYDGIQRGVDGDYTDTKEDSPMQATVTSPSDEIKRIDTTTTADMVPPNDTGAPIIIDREDEPILVDTPFIQEKEPETPPAPAEEETIIFAAGGENGVDTNEQIDDGGRSARVYTVRVHYPDKPVTLILGSYDPGIWNISVSKGTKISKIILGGYYGQKVAGISKNVPIQTYTYQDGKSNNYFYISKGETTKSSLKKWGNVDTIFYDTNGQILVGNPPARDTEWIQDSNNIPANYYKKRDNLSGKAGLDILVEKGIIRIATKEDANRWFDALIASPTSQISRDNGYPITDPDDLEILRKKYTPGYGMNRGTTHYVALQDFVLPGGMYWAFAFYIPEGVQVQGNISNGSLFDFNTLKCQGVCPR